MIDSDSWTNLFHFHKLYFIFNPFISTVSSIKNCFFQIMYHVNKTENLHYLHYSYSSLVKTFAFIKFLTF